MMLIEQNLFRMYESTLRCCKTTNWVDVAYEKSEKFMHRCMSRVLQVGKCPPTFQPLMYATPLQLPVLSLLYMKLSL